MQTLKAHVRKGRLVMNEPTEIPEGSEVELVAADLDDDLDDAERQRLHRALKASWTNARKGNTRPIAAIMRKLKGA